MTEAEQDLIDRDNYNSIQVFYKWSNRGRIIGQIKEKYGTTRWYAYLNSDFWLNDIFYPCHVYYRFPKWVRTIDMFINKWFIQPVFSKLIYKWRVYCYKQAYLECAKKYPKANHCIDYKEVFTEKELEKLK